jgi:hypothetical protein
MQVATKLRLDANAVVDGSTNPLFAAQVSLGSLDGNMPEKELNLFQFSAGCMAQFGARAPQIMRRQLCNAENSRVLFNDMPGYPLRYAVTPVFTRTTDTSEQSSRRES